MTQPCNHMRDLPRVNPSSSSGCKACIEKGDTWVHLRMCLHCGHVGCCDSSKNKHSTAHFQQTHHPTIISFEPGEDWRYCYVDKLFVE